MNGRPPSITLEQYRRIREAHELRRRLCDKALAREAGIAVGTVRRIVKQGIKRYDIELAREANRDR